MVHLDEKKIGRIPDGGGWRAHGPDSENARAAKRGNDYRAAEFTRKVVSLGGRHHRIRPCTPRHNGKVERCNRLMVDEVLYALPYTSETARREALQVWVNHDTYHRPHTCCGDAPPASLAPARVNNVMPSYKGYRTQTMVTLLMGLTSIVFIWILGLVLI